MTGIDPAAAFSAFTAGLLSVLSPCVAPLVPVYLSLVAGSSFDAPPDTGAARRCRGACAIPPALPAFVAGFSLIFVLMGTGAGLFGRSIGTYRDVLRLPAGIVIAALGLHLAGAFRLPFSLPSFAAGRFGIVGAKRPTQDAARKMTPAAAFYAGAACAVGWIPCIGPVLGGILALAATRGGVRDAAVLLTLYAVGLATPFLLALLGIDRIMAATRAIRTRASAVRRTAGLLLVVVGASVVAESSAFG